MAAVITRSYDNGRRGTITDETVLTPGAVGTRGIRKLFSLNIPGDRRGVEGQPLVVPGVTIADGSTHDVVYLADIVGAENLYHQAIFVDDATGAVMPPDPEMIQVGDAI